MTQHAQKRKAIHAQMKASAHSRKQLRSNLIDPAKRAVSDIADRVTPSFFPISQLKTRRFRSENGVRLEKIKVGRKAISLAGHVLQHEAARDYSKERTTALLGLAKQSGESACYATNEVLAKGGVLIGYAIAPFRNGYASIKAGINTVLKPVLAVPQQKPQG